MRNWIAERFEVSHGAHKTIVPMEGMRGLAVFLVFLAHYATLIDPWLAADGQASAMAWTVRSLGQSGVDLFFVLSGFLIYGMLVKRERPFMPYLRARIRRIYPAFLAVFAIYMVLSFAFPSESKLPDETGAAVVLIVQNLLFLPGLFDFVAIITVAWSLSYEFFYYLVMPLAIVTLGLRRWKPEQRLVLFVALSVIGFVLAGFHGGPIRLLMFLAGVVLFDLMAIGKPRKVPALGLVAVTIGIIASPLFKDVFGWPGWTQFAGMYLLFLYTCLDAFLDRGITARVFSYTPLRWFGNMSYSYYLIHGLALKFTFMVLHKVMPPTGEGGYFEWFLFIGPAFLITIGPSAALFLLVERPISLGKVKRA